MTIDASTSDHRPQLRLPGQAAAVSGPVDIFMMYVAHHGFRRDLHTFTRCVPHTPVDDHATWQALADRWGDLSRILHHHHMNEDEYVWPAMRGRARGAETEVLDAMESEHALIDPLLASCGDGFARMANAASGHARSALSVALVATREKLNSHLAHEETDAIAVLQHHFTHDEWEELDAHFRRGIAPGDLVRVVPWMFTGLNDSDRAAVASRMPRPMRIIAALRRRAFERSEYRAFRYDPAG